MKPWKNYIKKSLKAGIICQFASPVLDVFFSFFFFKKARSLHQLQGAQPDPCQKQILTPTYFFSFAQPLLVFATFPDSVIP